MTLLPPPQEVDIDTVSELRQLYTQARNFKRQYYTRWERNYKLVNNILGAGSANNNWQPRPKDSEIYPTISALVGWMGDQETRIDFIPAADPGSQYFNWVSQIANDLTAVLHSTWEAEAFDSQIKLGLWDAFLFGLGVYKSVWDNSISDGYGNATIKRIDPWTFYWDPAASSLLDSEYFVEVRRMSYQELCRRYPTSPEMDQALSGGGESSTDDKPNIFSGSTGRVTSNPGALPSGQIRWAKPSHNPYTSAKSDTFVVYEFWLKENDEWTSDDQQKVDDANGSHPELTEHYVDERWRVVVLCNNEILLDEYADELWSHGSHPYSRYCFDDIGEFVGISLVDHLADPQMYVNRLLGSVQHNVDLAGNPVFIDSKNSGLSRTSITNRPGTKLDVNPAAMANGVGPHWLDPPNIPQVVMPLIQFWISRIENTSGLSAIVKGATPTTRNAEGVMSAVQESAFVRIRSGLRNLEHTLRDLIGKTADLIIDNYTEPRIVATVGPGGTQTALLLSARHFEVPTSKGASPLKYLLKINAGSASPTSRQQRVAESDKLRAMGSLDVLGHLEAHQYPHAADVAKRIQDEAAQGLMTAPGARQRSGRSH